MKIEDLQDAIGQLDESIITEAGKARRKRKPSLRYRIGAVAAAIILVVISFAAIQVIRRKGNPSVSSVVALASPEYPIMHKRPSEEMMSGSASDQKAFDEAHTLWLADLQKQRDLPKGYQDGVVQLARAANRLLLTSNGENRVYSPLNVYLSLSLLAESTGGDTRTEILQILGVDTIEKLRAKANSLWNAHYMDDGNTTSLLANSVWLDKSLTVKEDTMRILQNTYMASAFQGDMHSVEMTKQLQKWLNEQTDHLLEVSVDKADFDEDTLMALVSTILFRAKWADEFIESNTTKGIFHSPKGSIETDFMYESFSKLYYWGDKFTAVSKGLINAGGMWFILPDEGVSVNELLDDPQVDALLQNSTSYHSTYENQKYLVVNFKVPKFDVMSDIQLEKALQELGIKSAFTASADFSPISETPDLYVSDSKHTARVLIDEKGVTGAAYTLTLSSAGIPEDEIVDFILDRPFLFVVQGHDGVPLFVGVVNQP